jgi:hypothetical protein
MHVVTAGVRDRHWTAVRIFSRCSARVVEACRLAYRERVHVGTQHDRGTIAIAQQPDDAGIADTARHVEAVLLEVFCGNARGAMLTHRQLRMSVDVLVGGLKRRKHADQVGHEPIGGFDRGVHEHIPARQWRQLKIRSVEPRSTSKGNGNGSRTLRHSQRAVLGGLQHSP